MKANTFRYRIQALFSNIANRIPPIAFLKHAISPLPDAQNSPLAANIYTKLIEKQMFALPIVKKLQSDSRYQMTRSSEAFANLENLQGPNSSKSDNAGVDCKNMKIARSGSMGFTADTLIVPGGISTLPLVFTDVNAKSAITIVHVGRRVTGFPMLVHGGILATLLDEALERVAVLGFPANLAVTANLKLDYLALTIAHQFLIIKSHCDEINNTKTKALASGTVETIKGKPLVSASGIFVAPKTFS